MNYAPPQNFMIINNYIPETLSKSHICLLNLSNLSDLFLISWIFHVLFQLAPSHFHEENFTISLLKHLSTIAFFHYITFIFMPHKKNPLSFMNFILIDEVAVDQKAYAIWLQSIVCHWNNLGPFRHCATTVNILY